MTAKRKADAGSAPIQPVIADRASAVPGTSGSGSRRGKQGYQFFPEHEPVPVGLRLDLGSPAEGRGPLDRGALLVRTLDPNFPCCWFSRALDLGTDDGGPAFWVLQKTARDTWRMSLRQAGGDVAAYHLRTRDDAFPITLTKGRVAKGYRHLPRTVTVRWAQ